MATAMSSAGPPAFYTVHEAARILRVDPSTLYRAIREGGFPAVRVRNRRYVVPAAVLDQLIAAAAETGCLVDPGQMAAERRIAREVERQSGGAW